MDSARAVLTGMLAIAGAPSIVAGQPGAQGAAAPTIEVGQRRSGRLAPTDPRFPNGLPFQVHQFAADSGKSYTITLRATAFDALLRIMLPVGGITHQLAMDDDAGGGRNALVRFTPRFPGTHLIVVTSVGTAVGPYELELQEVAARPLVVRTIAVGDTATGVLDDSSATSEDSNARQELYRFRATRGQRLQAVVRVAPRSASLTRLSSSTTPRIAFGCITNGRFTPVSTVATPGPTSGPTASCSSEGAVYRRGATGYHLDVLQDGEYAMRVVALSTGPAIPYVLYLSARSPASEAVTTTSRHALPGTTFTATLARRDPAADSAAYDEWTYIGRTRQRLTIAMESDEFDAYLQIGRGYGARFESLVEDDDGADGTNARLTFVLEDTGTYVIRARASDGDDGGTYTLRVDTATFMARRAQRGVVQRSREVHGVLSNDDAVLEDGSWYDEWVYEAVAHAAILITMRANDFDTFLTIGRMEAGRFVELAINDDATLPEGETDESRSRVVMIPPRSGPIVIRANTFGPGEGGSYTLRVDHARPSASGRTP